MLPENWSNFKIRRVVSMIHLHKLETENIGTLDNIALILSTRSKFRIQFFSNSYQVTTLICLWRDFLEMAYEFSQKQN